MEIAIITGVTEQKSIKWFKEVSEIMLTCETANIADTVLIKVRKQSKNGDVLIVPNLSINALAEITHQRQGYYEENRPTFSICDFGDFKLGDGEFFEIDLSGLTSGNAYKLHGVNYGFESDIPTIYTAVTVPNNTKRYDFVPKQNSIIAFPNSSKLTEVTLSTVMDTIIREDLHTLKQKQRRHNDLISVDTIAVPDTFTAGFKNYLTENMNGFVKCELETDGTGLEYIVVTGLNLLKRFQ